jgi:hypothetical protein
MQIFDPAALDLATLRVLNPPLRALVAAHLDQAKREGLTDLTLVAVIEPGDDELAIEAELGFSPVVNPMTGTRFGEPGWLAYWAWLQRTGGIASLTHTVGDSGYAIILVIPETPGIWPDLLQMVAAYSDGAPE